MTNLSYDSYGKFRRKFTPSTHIFSSSTKTLVTEKKMHDVEGIFLPDTPVDRSREKKVESGLALIFKHVSGPQFPRKIMTAISQGQKLVNYRDVALSHFEGALWKDCRISAFYPGQKNPDLIFIDLDARDFESERALKTALTKILNHIKNKIGGHPTVLWSGRGYHIIQPIDCTVNLDDIKEFRELVRDKEDVNKAFLQFASQYLSNGKKDKENRTSLNSCLLRIPHSLNSKCKGIEGGLDPEVKVIQEWDGHRPDYRLLMGSFYSHLVAKREEEVKKYASLTTSTTPTTPTTTTTPWIERLLQTPIEDHRKLARDLIIIPYLVVRRGMTDVNQIMGIVMQWADRWGELRRLEPSRREFEKKTESRVYEVLHDRIPPKRWDTLQQESPELAQKLRA